MTKTALENDFRVNTPNSDITVIISSCVDEEYKKSDALLKFCFGVFCVSLSLFTPYEHSFIFWIEGTVLQHVAL